MHIVIYYIVVTLSSLSLYRKVGSFSDVFRLSLIISFAFPITFQLLAYYFMGYLDPFFFFALIIQIATTFPLSFVIFIIILKIKEARKSGGKPQMWANMK
jgi:hypothetical protein